MEAKKGGKMIVSLSSGSIYRASPKKRILLLRLVERHFSGMIEGVELCFIRKEELDSFFLDKQAVDFLNSLKYNTLHAPIRNLMYGKNRQTKKIFEKILEIDKKVSLEQVVFHPHHVSDFNVLENFSLPVCIENMPDGKNKKGWQTPRDMKSFFEAYPEFGFCFDVNHGTSNGIKPIEFVKILGTKISQVHLNAISRKGMAGHKMIINSGKKGISQIKPVLELKRPLVIEVDATRHEIPLLKKEIKLVKSWIKP